MARLEKSPALFSNHGQIQVSHQTHRPVLGTMKVARLRPHTSAGSEVGLNGVKFSDKVYVVTVDQ
jgi:hypothetical protein